MNNKKTEQTIGKSEQSNLSGTTLSKSKIIIFSIILITLPFLLLLLVEIGLRIFNYGGNLDLFIQQKDGVTTNYVLNKDFTKRYFFQKGIETPVPLSQTFQAEKDHNTYRIFCLGESSVQGFPYPPNAAFPAMLKHLLTTLHPQKNIEVVNCGITAISSYSIVDMAEEIIEKYQPDLIVVYAGHNEFYGVFGSASRLSFLDNKTIANLTLELQHFKLFLLIRDFVNSLFGKDISKDPSVRRGTMMGIVAKDVGIPLNDEIVKRTEINFKNNLEKIIKTSQENKTNLIICNLVSNIKDFPPFASQHSNYYNPKDSLQWNLLFRKALESQNKKQYTQAITYYQELLKLDSAFAEIHYQLGKCYYEMQTFDLAKHHFERAVDLDVIRFRAPSSFNRMIENICAENRIPFANVNKDFEQISNNGIVGNELIFEHVHPNQQGYLQIAKSIASVMAENKMVQDTWDWSKKLTDNEYYATSGITILDKEIVNYMLSHLTSYWPFTIQHKRTYNRIGNEITEKFAKSYVKEEKNIVELHLAYAEILQAEEKYDDALAEYKAALSIQPISEIYNRIGRMYIIKTEKSYRDKKDYISAALSFEQGISWFKQALKKWPNDIELNFNLGILYFMRNDKWKDAEANFNKVLELNPAHKKSLLLLSQIYLHYGQNEEAGKLLKRGIELYPQQAEFYTDFGILLLQKKNLSEAKLNFEKAISLNNDPRAKHFLQVLNNSINN